MGRGAASVIGDTASTVEINLEDKILAREIVTLMMPSIESYLGEQSRQLRIVAMQGMGIVFLGNFAGMVAGLVLSPPPSTNIPLCDLRFFIWWIYWNFCCTNFDFEDN